MKAMSRTNKKFTTMLYIVLFFITFIVVFPLIWSVLLSFKTNSDILTDPFSLPKTFNFDNYIRAFNTLNLFGLYKNTFIIAFFAITIELVITFMSGFALSKMIFKRPALKKFIYTFLIIGLTIPPFILLFPIFKMTAFFKLQGTFAAIILPYIATSISFNTLLFTGYLRGLPKEIDEAALIDGCDLFRLCVKIIVPMAKPVIATILVFNVLYIWNEFPLASTLITDSAKHTISLGASYFKGRWNVDYTGIIASSVMIIIPQLLFYGFFQRYIVDGMTAGAVKG